MIRNARKNKYRIILRSYLHLLGDKESSFFLPENNTTLENITKNFKDFTVLDIAKIGKNSFYFTFTYLKSPSSLYKNHMISHRSYKTILSLKENQYYSCSFNQIGTYITVYRKT